MRVEYTLLLAERKASDASRGRRRRARLGRIGLLTLAVVRIGLLALAVVRIGLLRSLAVATRLLPVGEEEVGQLVDLAGVLQILSSQPIPSPTVNFTSPFSPLHSYPRLLSALLRVADGF